MAKAEAAAKGGKKEKKGAKEIDVAWLKEYQPPKK